MKQGLYTIVKNTPLTREVYELVLAGDTSAMTAPGQFVNLHLPELYLRRPISVCDWDAETMTLLYKVVGRGTVRMAAMKEGQVLDVLCGLGNGFDTAPGGQTPLLIGGGVGIPPLYGLCRRLLREGKKPAVLLGFNTASEIFYEDSFAALGVPVVLATADGSRGVRGLVTDAMAGLAYSHFYTCGPTAMLRAVNAAAQTDGQFSFEARMGCGFGACMGCSMETRGGIRRICKDGPVFRREEILW